MNTDRHGQADRRMKTSFAHGNIRERSSTSEPFTFIFVLHFLHFISFTHQVEAVLIAMSFSGKPLVVLGGWVGCQPRSLKRYISLYEKLGMKVLPVIAPPYAAVETTYSPRGEKIIGNGETKSLTLEGIALETISTISKNDSPSVIFHVFSNGGCFVWEQLRKFLDEPSSSSSSSTVNNNIDTDRLKASIKGIVFDSCPAWFGDETSVLARALELSTEEERAEIRRRFGTGVLGDESEELKRRRQQRCGEFFNFVKEDTFDIPQLYLYSADDHLADYRNIRDVIQHRRANGRRIILSKEWPESVHVAHLLKHAEDYTEAVTDFVGLALQQSRL